MPQTRLAPLSRRPGDDVDAIVVGAGHNGLITAAYLARAGLSVRVIEARATVGGTAASEHFAGARVNICSCDHLMFRSTPVFEDLALDRHGLVYDDVDPNTHYLSWSDRQAWTQYNDVEATLESLATALPGEVDGYRRYVQAALPAARTILDAASEPPSARALTRLARRRRFAGAPTLMRWSRRSAAEVLRGFFTNDATAAAAAVVGPVVWGVSPELRGTGLGALSMATRHIARVGRPVGGSGALPNAVLAALESHGGAVTTATKVVAIDCEGDGVRGVTLDDGTSVRARIVVSACDPHRTFLQWLRNPPTAARSTIERWQTIRHREGYESKLDAVLDRPPIVSSIGVPTGASVVVAPSLTEIHNAFRLMRTHGTVAERPAMIANVPTMLDATLLDPPVAPAGSNRHVFSLEALFTPYQLPGGWPDSEEPERWLAEFADLCEPGFIDSIIDWRAMTPDVYEREFHLPAGHATSFAGGPLAVFRARDPELTRYETAVRGLYLTGAATFPGAGVWGASGRNCATVVLDHLAA